MKVAVVIPTYNESKNLKNLVNNILGLELDIEIIVVDDNSPDGTGRIANQLAYLYPNVHVINRKAKKGRGSACIAGFKYALGLDIAYIFEMDADFSHDPKDIPRFLEKMNEFDVVIGSRYLKESHIINWQPYRKIFSYLANKYARLFLGIPITDYTNGYRCYSKKILSQVDFNKIYAKGYIVLSEMLYQLYKKKAKIFDFPINFINRRRGLSNLDLKEIISAFVTILRIKFRNI